MDIFDILTMAGGLCLFLFGMTIMGEALERAAGNSLRTILGKLTSGRFLGFLTALERIGDHCSNIAACIVNLHHHNRNTHETMRSAKLENRDFARQYADYAEKYRIN